MYRIRRHHVSTIGESDGWQEWPPEGSGVGVPDGAKAKLAVPLESDGWQDWPAEGASADAPAGKEAEPAGPSGKRLDAFESRHSVPATRQTGLAAPVLDAAHHPKPHRRTARTLALMLGALLLLAGGGWYGNYWWTAGRYLVSTDDAYVGAKNATLSAKITGYVSEVLVADNAHVREGDVIARIDDGDYQLAVQTARDNIATQQATIDRIGKQVAAQGAA